MASTVCVFYGDRLRLLY